MHPGPRDEARYREALAAAFIAVVSWGFVPVALRYFVSSLDPLIVSVIRFGASGVGALPFFWIGKPWRWPRADFIRLLICAALAVPGLNLPAAYAVRTLPAGGLGLVTATEPILIILFGLMASRSGVTIRVVMGALIALAGVLVTLSRSAQALIAGDNLGGIALAFAGAMSWSAYSVLGAPLVRRHGAIGMTGGVLFFGGFVAAAVIAPTIPVASWPGLRVFAEIGALALTTTVIGFLLWNRAGGVIGAAPLGLFLYLIPVIAVIGGAVFLGEALTLRVVLGGLVIIGGVAIGEGRGRETIGRLLRVSGRPAIPLDGKQS